MIAGLDKQTREWYHHLDAFQTRIMEIPWYLILLFSLENVTIVNPASVPERCRFSKVPPHGRAIMGQESTSILMGEVSPKYACKKDNGITLTWTCHWRETLLGCANGSNVDGGPRQSNTRLLQSSTGRLLFFCHLYRNLCISPRGSLALRNMSPLISHPSRNLICPLDFSIIDPLFSLDLECATSH